MGEPTEADLVNIATNFLLNAPPGEFMEVVTGDFFKVVNVLPPYICY